MRVSSAQIFNSGVNGILKVQSDVYRINNQMAANKRVVTPEDDPVAAAQALITEQAISVNEMYLKNQETAGSKLSLTDSTLDNINTELQNIYSAAMAAGNGGYTDSDRAAKAMELSERLSNLIALSNTQDGTGRYIFAGNKSTTEPFVISGNTSPYDLGNSYVTYQGDNGKQVLQVGAGQDMATNATGSETFMSVRDSTGALTGRSAFDAVQNMVTYLNTPLASASSADYTQALSDIQSSMDNASRVRSSVGARWSALDGMTTTGEAVAIQYEDRLSNLQDLDIVKATADLAAKKLQLEAAQSSFAATAKLTLFDYI